MTEKDGAIRDRDERIKKGWERLEVRWNSTWNRRDGDRLILN